MLLLIANQQAFPVRIELAGCRAPKCSSVHGPSRHFVCA